MSATPERTQLLAEVADILARLKDAGPLQMVVQAGGITHECFGSGFAWSETDGWLVRHDAVSQTRLDPAEVVTIVADRTMRMSGNRVLPRVEFKDADGRRVFAAYTLDGEAPFGAALAGLPSREPAPPEAAAPAAPGEAAADDAGYALLTRLAAAGAPVTIAMQRPGAFQRWRGALGELFPMRGTLNVVLDDFHLHVRAGAVMSWRTVEDAAGVTHVAVGPTGDAGLAITEGR